MSVLGTRQSKIPVGSPRHYNPTALQWLSVNYLSISCWLNHTVYDDMRNASLQAIVDAMTLHTVLRPHDVAVILIAGELLGTVGPGPGPYQHGHGSSDIPVICDAYPTAV